jgi:hypothetical protein
MVKKPSLTVIRPGGDHGPTPPSGLGTVGSAVWNSVQAQYRIEDSGGLSMLEQACRALDRAEACSDQIARDGMLIETPHGPREHPLLKHETVNRALAVRVLRQLGLSVEPVRAVGRPAKGFGWRGFE